MTPLHWAVDPSDWTRPAPAKITAAVIDARRGPARSC